MHSKASLLGHPVHPMLVAFPVASYVFTFAALVGFAATRDPFWYRASMVANLVGVVTAALAAIPGIIDLMGVPAGTTARRTGSIHAIAHVNALALFGINLAMALRLSAAGKPPVLSVALILTGAGVLLTAAGGLLGWKLVQRHHIGVAAAAVVEVDLGLRSARRWMEWQHTVGRRVAGGDQADHDEGSRSTAELRPRS